MPGAASGPQDPCIPTRRLALLTVPCCVPHIPRPSSPAPHAGCRLGSCEQAGTLRGRGQIWAPGGASPPHLAHSLQKTQNGGSIRLIAPDSWGPPAPLGGARSRKPRKRNPDFRLPRDRANGGVPEPPVEILSGPASPPLPLLAVPVQVGAGEQAPRALGRRERQVETVVSGSQREPPPLFSDPQAVVRVPEPAPRSPGDLLHPPMPTPHEAEKQVHHLHPCLCPLVGTGAGGRGVGGPSTAWEAGRVTPGESGGGVQAPGLGWS